MVDIDAEIETGDAQLYGRPCMLPKLGTIVSMDIGDRYITIRNIV